MHRLAMMSRWLPEDEAALHGTWPPSPVRRQLLPDRQPVIERVMPSRSSK
jgi:hypothetical protein